MIDVRQLPPTVDAQTAFRLLGMGRTLGFALIRRGEFPVRVIRCGARIRVPTAALLRVLEIDGGAGPDAT